MEALQNFDLVVTLNPFRQDGQFHAVACLDQGVEDDLTLGRSHVVDEMLI